MKIVHVADLHMEFSMCDLVGNKETVLVIAGDTYAVKKYGGILQTWLKDHCKRFKALVWVDGNHEFYKRPMCRVQNIMQQYNDEIENFHYLNDSEVWIEGQHFLGGTLWTNFNKGNPIARNAAMYGMNDYKSIKILHGDIAGRLRTGDVIELFESTYYFIQKHVTPESIVVTHHAPSYKSGNPSFVDDELQHCYYSDLEKEILEWQPKAWIHGHLHHNTSYRIGKTQVAAYSRGYNRHGTNNMVKELSI